VRQYVEKYPHEHIVLILKDTPLEETLLEKLDGIVIPGNIIRSDELGNDDTIESLEQLLQTLN
jgi:hypothetical protein